jgi:hypothetical protein
LPSPKTPTLPLSCHCCQHPSYNFLPPDTPADVPRSIQSSQKSLAQLPRNPNSSVVGHPHHFLQPLIDTHSTIPDSRAFCSQPQLLHSLQSTRQNLSQLPPTLISLSPVAYLSSQLLPAVDATASSQSQLSEPLQYSRNKVSQPPTKAHLYAADHSSHSSSQPLPKVDTTVMHSQVAGSQAQFSEPLQCFRVFSNFLKRTICLPWAIPLCHCWNLRHIHKALAVRLSSDNLWRAVLQASVLHQPPV